MANDIFAAQLEALRTRSLDRHLREISSAQGPIVDLLRHRTNSPGRAGTQLINFSSNDYLGLANDPRLRDAAIAAVKEFGVGAGASRLISGTQSPHLQLESALAKWKGTEAALTFSSGYATALGTIPALVSKGDVVVLDKLCHASLIDGTKLSGALIRVFPHNHLGKLESHLQWSRREHPRKRILIVTESVFSMDGDLAPLREIIDLKKQFGALLLLDEAHAVGVLGSNGRGLAAAENLNDDVDVQMGTLSKALGVSGGYICGSRTLIDWLINRARSFIYSTAPPPSVAGAARAAVDFLASSEGEKRRELLWRNIDIVREALSLKAESAIVPWIIGDEKAAVQMAASLRAEGFFVPAIRYPTVAKASARLRMTVTAAHTEDQIRALCAAIAKIRRDENRKPITA
jgi:8-amino-7-oxononanoate synthase